MEAPPPTVPPTVKKPLRELSVEEMLSQSFSLYSARFVDFFLPFLAAGFITGVFRMVVSSYFPFPDLPAPTAPPDVILEWVFSFLGALVATLVLTGVASWIVSTIANGVAVKYASDLLEKGSANLVDGVNFTVSRIVSLLAAGVITGVLTIVGLICLIVPGIIVAIMFSLVVPAIIIERISALDGLGRSRRLVRNRWGKTFILLLFIGIILLIVGLVADGIGSPFGSASSLVTGVITALIQPILPIATTFLYYSMAAREAQLAEPSQPPPPWQPLPTQPAPPPSAPPAKKYCVDCGLEMPQDAVYCARCGKRQP